MYEYATVLGKDKTLFDMLFVRQGFFSHSNNTVASHSDSQSRFVTVDNGTTISTGDLYSWDKYFLHTATTWLRCDIYASNPFSWCVEARSYRVLLSVFLRTLRTLKKIVDIFDALEEREGSTHSYRFALRTIANCPRKNPQGGHASIIRKKLNQL